MEEIGISLIIGILVTMVFSAFFSGMEIAFVSSNRMLAEMDKEKNGFTQRIISLFYSHPNGFVSTMLVGNNIALVVYGILIARLFDNTIFIGLDDGLKVSADTILSTLIVLFTGEFLPKTLFKSNPNRLLSLFSPLAYLCYVVLWPISKFSTFLSKILLKILGVKMDDETGDEGFSKVDLDYLVQSSIDNAEKDSDINDEVKIFQNALDFSDTKVRDCMVPRTEIQAVGLDATLEDLRQKFVESGNSKIVVYKDDIDHVEGYIHSSELFRNPKKLADVVASLNADSEYAAIFVPGGHGALIGLPESQDVAAALQWAIKNDRFVISLCHGPAAFLALRHGDNPLNGYSICAFPDAADKPTPEIGYMPGHLTWYFGEELKKMGMNIINDDITGRVHKDRKVLTGDSPFAANALGKLAAQEMLAAYAD